MAVTYSTDWTSFSDTDGTSGTLDWSLSAIQQNPTIYYYLEAIRQAVNERRLIQRPAYTVSNLFPELPGKNTPTMWKYTSGAFAGIQAAYNILYDPYAIVQSNYSALNVFNQFVNHKDHGGDWTGVDQGTVPYLDDSVAPIWTPTTMLADIGDDHYYYTTAETAVPLALQLKQAYEICRRLLWVRPGNNTYAGPGQYWSLSRQYYPIANGTMYFRDGVVERADSTHDRETDWGLLTASYNAGAWAEVSAVTSNYWAASLTGHATSFTGQWEQLIQRNITETKLIRVRAGYNMKFDGYYYFIYPGGTPDPTYIYEFAGSPSTVNKWAKVMSDETGTSSSILKYDPVFDIDDYHPSYWLSGEPPPQYLYRGFVAKYGMVVYKYDVPGGFALQ